MGPMPAPAPHPNRRERSSLPPELRRVGVPGPVRAWVAAQAGSAVVTAQRLAGASSSAVHRVFLDDGRSLVLRRYVWAGFLEDEPLAPEREVASLAVARRHGLPAPEVVAADVDGTGVGEGTPTVLMTFLAGQPVAVPDLHRLAEVAAAVHGVQAEPFGHDYFPWYRDTAAVPPMSTRPALWEAAIERWLGDMPPYRPTLVHRDFHPGNVLWLRRAASGIVDWANACRGPWGCDVAHCRGQLMRLSGTGAADRFQAEYECLTGRTYHPYWEMASVLEHGPSAWTPADIDRAEARLERALQAMG